MTWWMGLLAVLGVLGTRLLVEIGVDVLRNAFDRVFGPRADWARLVALCLSTTALAGALVWAARQDWGNSRVNGLLVICAFGAVAMAASQIYAYARTHDRRPRAHDPERTSL
jgi:hypothetical protein